MRTLAMVRAHPIITTQTLQTRMYLKNKYSRFLVYSLLHLLLEYILQIFLIFAWALLELTLLFIPSLFCVAIQNVGSKSFLRFSPHISSNRHLQVLFVKLKNAHARVSTTRKNDLQFYFKIKVHIWLYNQLSSGVSTKTLNHSFSQFLNVLF